MGIPTLFFLTLLGLCIGSFLNVLIYRLPLMIEGYSSNDSLEHLNLFQPPSFCTYCKDTIPIWGKIPLLSFLFLKGRTFCCKNKISLQYPFIEILFTLLTVYSALHFELQFTFFASLFLIGALVSIFFIDLHHHIIPDNLTLPTLWMGLFVNSYGFFTTLSSAIYGSIAGYISLWSIAWLFKKIKGYEGMGHGDFKLLAMLGGWLGWQSLFLIILIASSIGSIFGASYLFLKTKPFNSPIPFAPFLTLSGLIALFWKQPIIKWYIHW